MSDPQIIWSMDQAQKLPPKTVVVTGEWAALHTAEQLHPAWLPAVVVTPAHQVQTAINILQEVNN